MLRDNLAIWIDDERPHWPGTQTNPALLLNRRGGRLSARAADHILNAIADEAHINEFTPHVLRHTFGTRLEMSRIASGASFGKIRKRPLPATSSFELDQGRLVEASSHAS